jgi:chemotaxis regulatin CheY-phosphate phosphatase CheZ
MQSHHADVDVLKRELIGLFDHIQRIRREIASIRRPGAPGEDDHFTKMSDELDAIVQATEQATDTIMENVEHMEDVVNEVKGLVAGNAEAVAKLDAFPDYTGAIFEACAFQDITGQRITKVVTSLQYIEHRVNTLINMWGPDKLADETPVKDPADDGDEYKKYLNGPQLTGHGVSQADVDAMFGGAKPGAQASQTDIDALFDGPAQPAPPPQPAPTPRSAPAAKPAAATPAPSKPAPSKPAPVQSAPSKPAAAPAKPAAPKPAAKPAEEPDEGPKLGQDDIDKLFG